MKEWKDEWIGERMKGWMNRWKNERKEGWINEWMKNEYLSRCGVYCAANACIEQVIQHGEVDVFQAVKTVRRHRPQLVENLVTFLKGIDHEILELDFQFFFIYCS